MEKQLVANKRLTIFVVLLSHTARQDDILQIGQPQLVEGLLVQAD